MNDYNTVALIAVSLFISAAFCSISESYSQLYNPHGVKILSPTKDQEVPTKIQNFTVEGVSTDNSTNNCDVSLLLNGITPYVKVSSIGQNGPDDFSVWEHVFNSNLHLNVGENKLTARLLCPGDESSQIAKYHSVNFTGTNETPSTPITKVLNSLSTRNGISPTNITEIDESDSASSENETPSTPITKVLNSPSTRNGISPTNITEIDESGSTSSAFENQTDFMTSDKVARNITSGPVIIPPSGSQESSKIDSSPVNDSVIIPNATSSRSSSSNSTSAPVLIPPNQESSKIDSSPVNDSVIIPNATSSRSSSSNSTSAPVLIPPNEGTSLAGPSVPVNNQSYNPSNQVSKESIEQLESKSEENDDIPLIFPTPSPRITPNNERDNSVVDTAVRDVSPKIIVEKNNTDVVSSSLESNTSSNLLNQIESEPHTGAMHSNVKIPNLSESNFTGSNTGPNASTIKFKNQSETTLASNSSLKGSENGSSIRTLAGVDQIVNEGMEVSLSGDSTSTNNSQLSYEWSQVDGDVKVSLGQQNAKQISFQAPAVDKDSKLTFRFIASANGTQISSDEVNVIINDIPQVLEENESSDTQDEEMSENDDSEDDDEGDDDDDT